jgi:Helix-turn-helix domain
MQTQKQTVLKLLKNWLSPIDALNKAGCFRLAAVVHTLKSEGYDIEAKWHFTHDFKIYRLNPAKK